MREAEAKPGRMRLPPLGEQSRTLNCVNIQTPFIMRMDNDYRKFHQGISDHLDYFFEKFCVLALLFSTLCHLLLLFYPHFIHWRSDCSNNKETYLFGPGGNILNIYSSLVDSNHIGFSKNWFYWISWKKAEKICRITSLTHDQTEGSHGCFQMMHACRELA